MKLVSLSLLLMITVMSCQGQTAAKKQAEAIEKTMKALEPGRERTSASGWTMTCVIDGRKWTASSMFPPEPSGRFIGYYDKDFISFPRIQRRWLEVGTKRKISHEWAADFSLGADPDIYAGYTGELEITAMNGDWVEGKFFFTATSSRSNKKYEVTNGFFRVKVLE